ncbi:MAG: sugar phosphate nucleotidyltransferase [Promethearchaeota archaeon]
MSQLDKEFLENKEFLEKIIPVILCAGEGVRLKEITSKIPKPLILINALDNKPTLRHTIDLLLRVGVNRIAIVKGYLGNKIDDFIDKLKQERADFKEKLVEVDAMDQYKLGHLYSFLSITKTINLFRRNYIYLILPGDTIFEYELLNEIFSLLEENFKLKQKEPIIFFRQIKGSFLKQKDKSEQISCIDIEKINSRRFLKSIKQVKVSTISNSKSYNQIIPIFLFPWDFIQEIIKAEKKISVKTIREAVNHLINQRNRILVVKIDRKYNFYDIDNKFDLMELEKLKEKKVE